MRSGDVTVRRVDPSRIVHGRYEHSDANKQKQQPPDHAQDDETDRAEEREKNAAALPPPSDEDAPMPRLLANRPVLRWLHTGGGAASSTFDRFLTAPEDDEAPRRQIADHLAQSPQSSLQAMLARTDLPVADAPPPDDRTHDEAAARYDPPEPPPPSFDAEG